MTYVGMVTGNSAYSPLEAHQEGPGQLQNLDWITE